VTHCCSASPPRWPSFRTARQLWTDNFEARSIFQADIKSHLLGWRRLSDTLPERVTQTWNKARWKATGQGTSDSHLSSAEITTKQDIEFPSRENKWGDTVELGPRQGTAIYPVFFWQGATCGWHDSRKTRPDFTRDKLLTLTLRSQAPVFVLGCCSLGSSVATFSRFKPHGVLNAVPEHHTTPINTAQEPPPNQYSTQFRGYSISTPEM